MAPSRRGFLTTGAAAAATGLLPGNAATQQSPDRLLKARRILLKGGMVLSLDPKVGDHEKADVLIEGTKIVAVGPNAGASATSALVVDASGMIVIDRKSVV
jgi:5-methylthioadenosine/S-adenosylhomocysteine deaminase